MLHRPPDLKYFCGGVPTAGNLPDDCWLKEQSLPEPFLCFPQAFLQRPLRNRQRPPPQQSVTKTLHCSSCFYSLATTQALRPHRLRSQPPARLLAITSHPYPDSSHPTFPRAARLISHKCHCCQNTATQWLLLFIGEKPGHSACLD